MEWKGQCVVAAMVALFTIAAALGAGRIECAAPVFDFGTTQDLATVEHEFVLRNEGDTPVTIRRIRSTCGCTAATVGETVVQPGTGAGLQTRFVLGGRRGPQRKSFRVETDSAQTPIVELWHVGVVEADVALEPPFVNMGRIDGRQPSVRDVAVATRKPGSWIQSVSCSSAEFSVTPVGGAQPRAFRVATVPPLAPGTKIGKITVVTTGLVTRVLALDVAAVVEGAVQVVPRQFTLSRGEGRTQRRSILVRARQASPFTITRIELPDAAGRADWAVLGAGLCRIDITGIEPGEHLQEESVVILTDSPDIGEIRIPIRLAP